jgi:hypothetical protein
MSTVDLMAVVVQAVEQFEERAKQGDAVADKVPLHDQLKVRPTMLPNNVPYQIAVNIV